MYDVTTISGIWDGSADIRYPIIEAPAVPGSEAQQGAIPEISIFMLSLGPPSLSLYLSIHLSTYLSIYRSNYLSIYVSF